MRQALPQLGCQLVLLLGGFQRRQGSHDRVVGLLVDAPQRDDGIADRTSVGIGDRCGLEGGEGVQDSGVGRLERFHDLTDGQVDRIGCGQRLDEFGDLVAEVVMQKLFPVLRLVVLGGPQLGEVGVEQRDGPRQGRHVLRPDRLGADRLAGVLERAEELGPFLVELPVFGRVDDRVDLHGEPVPDRQVPAVLVRNHGLRRPCRLGPTLREHLIEPFVEGHQRLGECGDRLVVVDPPVPVGVGQPVEGQPG